MKVRETVLRPLDNEPDPVVRVDAVDSLRTDIDEYVLTERLAEEYRKIFERVVESARPGATGSPKVGVWISGFFGSGKSHFAKLAGHLLADTPIGQETARGRFGLLLQNDQPSEEALAAFFQQAKNYRLNCHLTTFDITRLQAHEAEGNVELVFLRAFYKSLDYSSVISFARIEQRLTEEGVYDDFLKEFAAEASAEWRDERDVASFALPPLSRVLPNVLPKTYKSADEARTAIESDIQTVREQTDTDDVVSALMQWVGTQPDNTVIVFVVDEVGAWASGDIRRIEKVRGFVEAIESKAKGKIWLLATSQERLSDLVKNTTDDQNFLQRLEARFQTNVHLESSEVGTVIETRILKKKPGGVSSLETLYGNREQVLRDVAEPPGLELGAEYPKADREHFVSDYPFLPYQLQASADLFGGMRGVKVSSGARSMITMAFDALKDLADKDLGAVVSWDQIFDSANTDNEFADENYLGSQGLEYIGTADRDVKGIAFSNPSRILKALWLVQQSNRIPRTEKNIARLLVTTLDDDVLALEQQVREALEALEKKQFVRREVTTGQWKFLTQDEVTVEKIVARLAEDLKQSRLKKEISELSSKALGSVLTGRVTHGQSNTTFEYGVAYGSTSLKNQNAEVQIDVLADDSPQVQAAKDGIAETLNTPRVIWILPALPKLQERLRRAIAIQMLPDDEEFRRIATDRTRAEADKLAKEGGELRKTIENDVDNLFKRGTLIYAGQDVEIDDTQGGAKGRIETALRDRIDFVYTRFSEGDKKFDEKIIEKLFNTPPGERMALDQDVGLFGPDGHLHSNNVLVEEVISYLKASMKTSGADIIERFSKPRFGWPPDLMRYICAAMFVDGKVSVKDKTGKPFDDPRQAQAKALFAGVVAFRGAHLNVEEDAATPDEITKARELLTSLGRAPQDGTDIAIKDAALQVCADLTRRAALIEKASNFGMPLPTVFDGLPAMIDEVQSAGSRVKVLRAVLLRGDELLAAHGAFTKLEDFDKNHGFEQYKRSRDLLSAAIDAGLRDDAQHGAAVQDAEEQTGILIEQRRVLDEWSGAYKTYRGNVIDAFRSIYAPLREDLSKRSTAANQAIQAMPELEELSVTDRAAVRGEFLGDGKPLQAVTLPELRDEEQLLSANQQFSIPHMRVLLGGIDAECGRAKARVLELHNKMLVERGDKERTATWSPAQAFGGKRFQTEDQVEDAFNAERDRLKALVRDGKTIDVI